MPKKSTTKYPSELIDTLKSCPYIETIYVNASGEWAFNEREDFHKKVSSEEILIAGVDEIIPARLADALKAEDVVLKIVEETT